MKRIRGGHVIIDPVTHGEEISSRLIEVIGTNFTSIYEVIYSEDIEAFKSMINKTQQSSEHQSMNVRIFNPNNHNIIMACDSDIEDNKIIIIMNDITAEISAKLMLEEAHKEAETALRAKSRFLATMSHEIRTPLNGIIGISELLKQTEISPDIKDSIDTINLCSQLLLTLVNNILDYSKLEEGKLSLANDRFNLIRCCENIIAMLKPNIGMKPVDIMFAAERDVPEYILGDQVRITQILTNIIGNAIKFTDHGFVKITVYSSPVTIKRVQLCFDVEDTGIGISKEGISSLFNTYNQIDTQNKLGGTGLGLVIARNLCKLMNGDISVTSVLGQGSIFKINIEATISTRGRCVDDLLTCSSSTDDLYVPKDLKILAAEDNKVNQTVLRKMLSHLGHSCDMVENGLQAVNCMKRNGNYDIILMDIHMPIMNGYEATKIIRELGFNKVKIIAFTANAMKEDKDLCIDAKMDDYICKPVTMRNLKTVLSRVTATTSHDG